MACGDDGRKLAADRPVQRDIRREDRGLAVFRFAQLLFRAVGLEREQIVTEHLGRALERGARLRRMRRDVASHADALRPLPRKTDADAHLSGPPPRNRAPREAAAERHEDDHVAVVTMPARTVSESAIGIEAADVLPYSAMLTTTLSSGKFK